MDRAVVVMPSVANLDGAVLGCRAPGIFRASPNRDRNDERDSNRFRPASMESVLMAWIFRGRECEGVCVCVCARNLLPKF